MNRRDRRSRARGFGGGAGSRVYWHPSCGGPPPDDLAKVLRTSCSACGSSAIEWTDLDAARAAGIDVDELVAAVGAVEEVWRCLRCDEWGFFGPTVWGF